MDILIIVSLILFVITLIILLKDVITNRSFSRKYDQSVVDEAVSGFLCTEEKSGHFFVKLMQIGKLRTIKGKNHGADFSDKKQLENFKRYSTKTISLALDEIGEGI